MKRLCFLIPFFFCILFTQNVQAGISSVRIYSGEGASQSSVKLIASMFQRHVKPAPQILYFEKLSSLIDNLKEDTEASLLVMPGGSTILYEHQFTSKISSEQREFLVQALRGKGPTQVSYLGIGAGAFFAATDYKISFQMEDREKSQLIHYASPYNMKRLNLFPTMSSAFQDFNPKNDEGARFPIISLQTGEKGTVFWNGGPAFGSSYSYAYNVLASFDENTFAIVGRKLGENAFAVISGLQFEFDPYDSNNEFDIKDFPTHLHNGIRNGGIAKETAITVLKYLGFTI